MNEQIPILKPEQLTLSRLGTFVWGAADNLSGNVHASEFKDYIFAKLFLKRVPHKRERNSR